MISSSFGVLAEEGCRGGGTRGGKCGGELGA